MDILTLRVKIFSGVGEQGNKAKQNFCCIKCVWSKRIRAIRTRILSNLRTFVGEERTRMESQWRRDGLALALESQLSEIHDRASMSPHG